MKVVKKACAKIIYKILKRVQKQSNMIRETYYEAGNLSDERKRAEIQRKCWFDFKRCRSIINNPKYLQPLEHLPDYYQRDVQRMLKDVEKI